MVPEITRLLIFALIALPIPIAIIIITLTGHQRKMAELIHGKSTGTSDQLLQQVLIENQQMRNELKSLNDRLNDQLAPSEGTLVSRITQNGSSQ